MTSTFGRSAGILIPTVIVPVFWMLSGCGPGSNLPPATPAAVAQEKSGLSGAEHAAVTDAARQMTADPAAGVHGLVGRRHPDAPAKHVCGYVTRAAHTSTPLYVELQEKDGAIIAERGQIGASPANLAKVRFMCRNHGDW